ncbi:MAG TPA: hypothetical protein VJT73_11740 [Polyangiaceae bacterium]|nr:hypothetical protein [Polyangiaceae bacterium]
MSDQPDNPDNQAPVRTDSPPTNSGVVTLNGESYQITPTAFRSHYQVTTADGKLVGLIESMETDVGRKFTARPASGAGMTQSLMMKIAEAAAASGVIK